MKKLLTLLFLCFSITAFSQEYNKEEAQNYVYCQLVGTSNLLGTKVTVEIDFGQKKKLFESTRLKGKDGKPIKFNSMIDALNYMGNQGWEFEQAYAIYTGNSNVYHYLLKKPVTKSELEEIVEAE